MNCQKVISERKKNTTVIINKITEALLYLVHRNASTFYCYCQWKKGKKMKRSNRSTGKHDQFTE